MLFLLLSPGEGTAAPLEVLGRPDRIDTAVNAYVEDDLSSVLVEVETVWWPSSPRAYVPVVLGAERYRTAPEPLLPAMEPLLFARGMSAGGFDAWSVEVEGVPCRGPLERLSDGARWLRCGRPVAGGASVRVVAKAKLRVPNRYGPFGRRGRQLTLGARWYPQVASPHRAPPEGRIRLSVSIPAATAAIVGEHFVPHDPGTGRREVRASLSRAAHAPLLVLPPETVLFRMSQGALVFPPGRSQHPADLRRKQAFLRVLEDGLHFLRRARVRLRRPVLLVEAPLRRDLARGLEGGVVLVSDHAYRFWPIDRFDAFHDRPILRQVFFAGALQGAPKRPVTWPAIAADAVAQALVDALDREGGRRAEDAFDVLGLFAFVPAIDSLLYAPQLPFVEAYFRVIREDDPLRAELAGHPSERPRGKIVYEKLADRSGQEQALLALRAVLRGAPLEAAVARGLEGTPGPGPEAFLATWLGPHPEVAYRLGDFSSAPLAPDLHRARVEVIRSGDAVAEPVTVRIEDSEGRALDVLAEASTAPIRVVTATLSAPLAAVSIDPAGRLSQVPSAGAPNPRLDDHSHPGWRVLLDGFNVLIGATAGAVDARLAFAFARRWDPTWQLGVAASSGPDAVSGTVRLRRAFGRPVTPNRQIASLSASFTGDRLLAGFVEGAAAAWAGRTELTFAYDDRMTLWAPEPGIGLRASLGYARIFDADEILERRETNESVSIGVAGLRSVRLHAAHTLSLRGRLDAWVLGRPRPQLLYDLGGRGAVRGYPIGEERGRLRAVVSGEWLHPLLRDLRINAFELTWVDRVDGALFADGAVLGDDPEDLARRGLRADIGYGLRIYLSYLGVRPGVLAVDVAFPLLDEAGRLTARGPQVFLAFSQSFLSF